jgi:pyruvate/2-oxoglutarate dehydrogenase complex dihydrolipoamide dehydrogenase (E3) component
VTVVEMLEEILVREDAEIVGHVREMLVGEGIMLLTGWAVKSIHGKTARIENRLGEVRLLDFDSVFVASGRRGNTENLGLEDAGVTTERSYVVVDKFLRTSAPRIWACGDVHGGLQFTHVAAYEAVKLVRNMLFPGKSAVDYSNVPWTLYTDPEVAHVGLTEAEAREKHGATVRAHVVRMEDVDRAVVDRTPIGMIKLITDGRGRILGGHAFCANASSVIQEVVLARRKGMKVGELAQRISSYPSLADGVQKAASLHYQELATGWLGAVGKLIAAASQ